MRLTFNSPISAVLAIIVTVLFLYSLGFYNQYVITPTEPNNIYKDTMNEPLTIQDDSYSPLYQLAPHSNNVITYYTNELNNSMEEFINAIDRYDIFKARIQYGLALECINKELKQSKIDWWEESDKYRVNARNSYAHAPQKIAQSKANELFLFDNQRIFDFNLIKDIETTLLYPTSKQGKDICKEKISVDILFSMFVKVYLDRYDLVNNSKEWHKSFSPYEAEYFDKKEQILVQKKQARMKKKLKEKLKTKKRIKENEKQYKIKKQERDENKFLELKKYIASNKDIEIRDKRGYTLLHNAVESKNLKVIELLLKHGANMYARDIYDMYTPFSKAMNDLEVAKIFLKYHVNVNYQYKKSETGLTQASKGCKNFDLVKLLLANGANPNLIDKFTFTTKTGLFRYCKKGGNYEKMMKLLAN